MIDNESKHSIYWCDYIFKRVSIIVGILHRVVGYRTFKLWKNQLLVFTLWSLNISEQFEPQKPHLKICIIYKFTVHPKRF